MKLICKQCGKEFTITDGEKEFYKSKNLALPKRCKNCRNSNKKKRSNFKVIENKELEADKTEVKAANTVSKNIVIPSPNNKRNAFLTGIAMLVVIALLAAMNIFGVSEENQNLSDTANDIELTESTDEAVSEVIVSEVAADVLSEAIVSESEKTQVNLQFRNDNLYYQHYEKHGIEMGFTSAEEYLAAANAVVNNPEVLHKYEAEDGDDVYFLEATEEFVVVSTDGYIRTYYYADKDYFERQ